MLRIALLCFILFAFIAELQSGWLITERITGSEPEITVENTLYINNNIIKTVERDHTYIYNLNRWTVTILNHEFNGYWTGTPGEYLGYMKDSAKKYLEEQISIADEYDREYLITIYEDLKLDIIQENAAVHFVGELPVEIVMTDNQDRLAGYRVNQFIVYVNQMKVEELWLTRDVNLADDFDYEKFRNFIDEMTWGNFLEDYRSSKNYIHLVKSGVPLRTVEELDNGTTSITEVTRIEKKDIPESEFRPPPDYQSMSLTELQLDIF